MAMDLTCLNIYPPLPTIPITANVSNHSVPSNYQPNSGGISQMISAAIARSTFSTNDIHSLLNNLFNKSSSTWNVSEIIKIKPISSIIIYSAIALSLFLILSLIFCIVSCRNSNKYQRKQKRQSKCIQVCVCLLIIVYLLGIGDMIYVAYRVNKSKLSLDDTIKEANRDIYPKEISEHMKYLIKQFQRLDQYVIEPNSILINASKSILVKAFDGVLKEKYFVENILQSVNSIDKHIQELNDTIEKESTIPQSAIDIFHDIQEQYQTMIDYIQKPLKEVCNYANGTETDIDKKLLEVLDIVHVKLKGVIDIIERDILNKITPWQNHMLINTDTEEQIRAYMNLVGNIFLVLVITLGGIPVIFFVFIIISRLCGCDQNKSCYNNDDPIQMTNVREVPDASSRDNYSDNEDYHRYNTRNKIISAHHHRQQSRSKRVNSNNGPSGVVLCLMRIAFVVMIIILIVMVLLTGVYYALDLAVQGTCRTVHDDQPFLINFITDKLIEFNLIFVNASTMNTTVANVIHDCRDHVHFSRKLFENYWFILNDEVEDMMNTLSQQIFDQFIKSIGEIDIPLDIDLLVQFVNQANISNIPVIVQGIETDLTTIEGFFEKINSSNSTLPQSLIQSTIAEFKGYVQEVIELTVDACPLPLATIYKTDTLVCHTLGSSISGLWLSVFFFMFLITFGLSIFGVCIYKRLNGASESIPATIRRF